MIDQAEKLRRQLNKGHKGDSNKAKTIAFISGKGGVGKSNVALNFALELLEQGKKVLLFDLDIGMGNVEILLGLNAEKTIVNMFDEGIGFTDIIEKGPRDLAYISGGSGLNRLFELNQKNMDFFYSQYEEIVLQYDFILFDMGAGATETSMFFVLASDECIVVTTPEPTALTDAYSMIKQIVNNQRKMPIYIVMNQALNPKIGTKALGQFKQVIKRFLHVDVQMLGILPKDKLVTTAVIKQVPYVMLNSKAAISKATKSLAATYLASTASGTVLHHEETFINKLKRYIIAR